MNSDCQTTLKACRGYLLVLVCLLASCDYSLSLPNAYSLMRASPGSFALLDPDGKVLLGPTVKCYQVSGFELWSEVVYEPRNEGGVS